MSDLNAEIVEHLVAMRKQLDSMNEDAFDLVRRMDGLIDRFAAITACTDRIDTRLDRIEGRLDRIVTKMH